MIYEDSKFVFSSTGRSFYANCYIGITEQDDGNIIIAQGYDGGIDIEEADGSILINDELEPVNPMTNLEREELANYMILLWQQFKTDNK